VEERNGKRYVKFQGKVKSSQDQGQRLVVNFKDGGEVTLTPPPETKLYVNGKKTPVADLARGDQLNFYIAEDRLAAQFPEIETSSAQFVIVPIVVREQQLASLPSTASPMPWLAMVGTFSLGLGALLSLYRRRR
jgi:LPXTG-motif cell wall-anchored protein